MKKELWGDGESGAQPGYLVALRRLSNDIPIPSPRESVDFFDDLLVQVRVTSELERLDILDQRANRSRRSLFQPDLQENLSVHRLDEGTPIAWAQKAPTQLDARDQYAWAMVLGNAGAGKSTLLKYEAWLSAGAAIDALSNQRLPIEQVDLPVFLRLPDLANLLHDTPQNAGTEMVDVLLQLIADPTASGFPVSSNCLELLRTKLLRGDIVMLLDSMDEVVREQGERLTKWLKTWMNLHPPNRLYVASRTAGFIGMPGFMSQRPGTACLEIMGFRDNDVRHFVTAYCGDVAASNGDKVAKKVHDALDKSASLRALAKTPLMVTLICAAASADRETDIPLSRSRLLSECLDGLLGRWRKLRHGSTDSFETAEELELIVAKRRLLARLAGNLTNADPGRTAFTWQDMLGAFNDSGCRSDLDALKWGPSQAIDVFCQVDGVMRRIGRGTSARFSFIHRTVQEYLIACAMIIDDESLSSISTKIYDPRWEDVLSLLPGVVSQINVENRGAELAVISQLLNENRKDVLCRPLFAAGRAASELEHETTAARIAALILELLKDDVGVVEIIDEGNTYIERLLRGLGGAAIDAITSDLDDCLDSATDEELGDVWAWLFELLVRLDEHAAIAHISKILCTCGPLAKSSAIEFAFDEFGISLSFLFRLLEKAILDEDEYVILALLDGLLAIGEIPDRFLNSVLSWLDLEDGDVVENCFHVLARLRPEELKENVRQANDAALSQFLMALQHVQVKDDIAHCVLSSGFASNDPAIRVGTVELMRKYGFPLTACLELLDDSDGDVRQIAMQQLEETEIEDCEIIVRLEDNNVAEWLGCWQSEERQNSPLFQELIRIGLNSYKPWVRIAALEELRRDGQFDLSLTAVLKRLLEGADDDVRLAAEQVFRECRGKARTVAKRRESIDQNLTPRVNEQKKEAVPKTSSDAGLIESLQSSDEVERLNAAQLARRSMMRRDKDVEELATQTLLDLLEASNDSIRERAAAMIHDSHPAEAQRVFQELLTSSSLLQQTMVARTIMRCDSGEALRRQARQILWRVLRAPASVSTYVLLAARTLIEHDNGGVDVLEHVQHLLEDEFTSVAQLIVAVGETSTELAAKLETELVTASGFSRILAARVLRRIPSQPVGPDRLNDIEAAQHLRLTSSIEAVIHELGCDPAKASTRDTKGEGGQEPVAKGFISSEDSSMTGEIAALIEWWKENEGPPDGPTHPLLEQELIKLWNDSQECPTAEKLAYRVSSVFCQLEGRSFPIQKDEWGESSLNGVFRQGLSRLRSWKGLSALLQLERLPKPESVRINYSRARKRMASPRRGKSIVRPGDAGQQHWKDSD